MVPRRCRVNHYRKQRHRSHELKLALLTNPYSSSNPLATFIEPPNPDGLGPCGLGFGDLGVLLESCFPIKTSDSRVWQDLN